MSSDNFILVDKHDNKYRISMQFASCEEYFFRGNEEEFDELEEAVDGAYEWMVDTSIVEYGISIDPRCYEQDSEDDEKLEFLIDCGA